MAQCYRNLKLRQWVLTIYIEYLGGRLAHKEKTTVELC